ncbi:MAG: hypothetical protein H6844_08120 [Alphaproteobacteria bacterium]|nr:hypothetical protein [Alphaproteobacteria bacterium]
MDKRPETWVDVLGIDQEYEEQIGQTKLAHAAGRRETIANCSQATGPDSPVDGIA